MAVTTVPVSEHPSKSLVNDIRRAREFYRYLEPQDVIPKQYKPSTGGFAEHRDESPDLSTSLSPYCQLVALRCNVRKAMLSFIDRDTMFVLAEAYRATSQTSDPSEFGFQEDPILSSCSSMSSKDRVCEMTIRVNPSNETGEIPMYQISDMSASRFSSVPVVCGPPYYRFYAGTPITTKAGINIGSLSVMDTVPREGLTIPEQQFLGQTAAQIMAYLETNRQAIDGRRSIRMAKSIEAFVAGKRSLREHTDSHIKPITTAGQPSSNGVRRDSYNEKWPENITSPGNIQSRTGRDMAEESSSDELESPDEPESPSVDDEMQSRSHTTTFARAANVLREAFWEPGEEGGIFFVQTGGDLGRRSSERDYTRSKSFSNSLPMKDNGLGSASSNSDQLATVLASSTNEAPHLEKGSSSASACLITENTLQDLTKRYPGGSLWSFDDWTNSSSSEGESGDSQPRRIKPTSKRSKRERAELMAAFPGARQLLFAPIWDPNLGSFARSLFVTTTLEIRSMSATTNLSFVHSFCSTLMAECSRLEAMVAAKQKDDFVGTISHEMRSPLHGILASVEFLSDTELDSFQRSLIDTVGSCGNTLLDTIGHVLDYSKINSFQKHWQSSNKRVSHKSPRKHHLGPDNASKHFSSGAPPLLQLFGVTNVSIVLEEVVEGLILGQTYSYDIDITDVSRQARGRGGVGSNVPNGDRKKHLEFVIDIQQADWAFLTQPGAIRRIMQNLVGNALKYCSQGHIIVSLELKDTREPEDQSMIFRVADTGCGMSSSFLSRRLFTPFCQEDSLAPGTGLGLSIVHSIVTMLGGTVDVQSEVGKGTVVEVRLPLKRPMPGQQSTSAAPHSGSTIASTASTIDDPATVLQEMSGDITVALYKPDGQHRQNNFAEVLSKYVQGWLNLKLVEQHADIVLVDEEDIGHLFEQVAVDPPTWAAVLVLCSVETRYSAVYISQLQGQLHGIVELIVKPFGPNRMAKSVLAVLERTAATTQTSLAVPDLDTIEEQITPTMLQADPSSDAIVDQLHEMDLNGPGESDSAQVVQATETFAASQTSQHAQKALHGSSEGLEQNSKDSNSFPFPDQHPPHEPETGIVQETRAPHIPAVHHSQSANGAMDLAVSNGQQDGEFSPHILVVDDNVINLKLLETYLKAKRKYTNIESADDGQKAVDAVTTTNRPFDIIFMDISMPVMNGFEATRAIRDFERQEPNTNGVMIIALTGLASGRDQAEGFEAGCDLYMTKPVSFKEVGKLLDNWEMHEHLEEHVT